jgi:hypothetical protein
MAAVTESPVRGAKDPVDPVELATAAAAPAPALADVAAVAGLVSAGPGEASVPAEQPARAVIIPQVDAATAHRTPIPRLAMGLAAVQG